MKNVILKHKFRPIHIILFALLLSAALLLCPGCDTPSGTDQAETGEMASQPAAPEREPEREVPPDLDPSAYSGLVLSKIYGNGGSATAACEHSFVELTNTGSDPLDLGYLALYYRTGEKAAYTSFRLPDMTLAAGESCLIRGASAAGKAGEYDRSCEVLRLEDCDAEWDIALDNRDIKLVLAPAGKAFDRETPPEALPGMISYFVASDEYAFDTGHVSELSRNTMAVRTAMKQDSGYYLLNLTKATSEKLAQIAPVTREGKRAAVIGSKLEEVRFSQPAGFYSEPFELVLTPPAGYGTVYYTTDGSDPTTSGTRKPYTEVIKLTDTTETDFGRTYQTGLRVVGQIASHTKKMLGAHVIKACAYNGIRYTGVYTNTYFVSAAMAEYGVTVMSVSLETKQMFGNPGFYHNFNPSTNDPNTRGRAFLEVFDKDGVRRGYSNVELAASGHGSSGTGMRSMKVFYKGSENEADGAESALHFDLFDGYARNAKGQCITDFSRLLLRNSGNDCGGSYIRDAYMQRVSDGMAVDTMAYAPVLVFINGDFWGIYNARERYSGDYVASHYGIDKDNVALIESDYSQVHTNQNAPFIVSSGLPDDADDFNELVSFIRKNDLKEDENYAYVCDQLDTDSLIDLFVSRLYFSARDFPENNIKLWRCRVSDDPSGADCRWHFVLLDMDMGISFFKDANSTTEKSDYFGWLNSTSSVAATIIKKMLTNTAFRNRFLARFYEVLNEVYVPAQLEEKLDRIVAQREPIESLQSDRWGASMSTYRTAIADMRQFVGNRRKFVLRFLCAHFKVSEDDLRNLGGEE